MKTIRRLSITILPAMDKTVMTAASLQMDYAISCADAFAAAETKQRGLIMLAGDPELFQIEGVV